jgi:flavodoxin
MEKNIMRRTASEVIKELQKRVARLEKSGRQYKITVQSRSTVIPEYSEVIEGSGPWDREQITMSELLQFMEGLEYCSTENHGKYYVLMGHGDYSGDLYEFKIEKAVFLETLVQAYFASALDKWS